MPASLSWGTALATSRSIRHVMFSMKAGLTLNWATDLSLQEIDEQLEKLGAYKTYQLGNDGSASKLSQALEGYQFASADCYHAAELFDPENLGSLDKLLALRSAWNFSQHALYILVERTRKLGDALKEAGGDLAELSSAMKTFKKVADKVTEKRGTHTHEREVQTFQILRLERLWMTVSILPQVTQAEFDDIVVESIASLRAAYVRDFTQIYSAIEIAFSSAIIPALEKILGVDLTILLKPVSSAEP